MPVYPRWRGEHRGRLRRGTAETGLSPLARGTHGTVCDLPDARRFIPAGAGNTPHDIQEYTNIPVYPRWRGEHKKNFQSSADNGGLSPLARGTPVRRSRPAGLCRFIPAGAGNTPPWAGTARRRTVYPRWRGEHADPHLHHAGNIGLSPLARGTQLSRGVNAKCLRFIPAGAGNTFLLLGCFFVWWVYPRWRGEHSSPRSAAISIAGLSPLARGTRDLYAGPGR